MIVAIKPPYAYVGGKRRLLNVIGENIPQQFGDYYEPFLGAGAVSIHVMENFPDRHYYLSDWNPHIPATWLAIQHHIDEVIELLQEHRTRHNQGYFYSVRNFDRFGMFSQMSLPEIAARFIYICSSSFGGGYKLSKVGYSVNVYAEGKSDWGIQEKNLRNLSALLNDRAVHIYRRDFMKVAEHMGAGDLLYLDPPYATDMEDPDYKGNDSYIKLQSTAEIVHDVYVLMDVANTSGSYALASNARTVTTEELWKGWNKVRTELTWNGGKNVGRAPQVEMLWGNNALYRVLNSEPKELPEPVKADKPKKPQKATEAPSSDQIELEAPEPQ